MEGNGGQWRAMGSYLIILHLEPGAAEVIHGFSVDGCCGMERPFRALGLAGFDTLGDAQGWYGADLWPSKAARSEARGIGSVPHFDTWFDLLLGRERV